MNMSDDIKRYHVIVDNKHTTVSLDSLLVELLREKMNVSEEAFKTWISGQCNDINEMSKAQNNAPAAGLSRLVQQRGFLVLAGKRAS